MHQIVYYGKIKGWSIFLPSWEKTTREQDTFYFHLSRWCLLSKNFLKKKVCGGDSNLRSRLTSPALYRLASFPGPSFSFNREGEKLGLVHTVCACAPITKNHGNLDISAVFYFVTLWMMAAASHRRLQLTPVHLYYLSWCFQMKI